MTAYKDSYTARLAIEDALSWLKHEDGWTRDDLEELAQDSVDVLFEDEE